MEQPKNPAQMSDEEFEEYQRQREKEDIINKYSLDKMDKDNNLNQIDENGNIIDKDGNIIGKLNDQ